MVHESHFEPPFRCGPGGANEWYKCFRGPDPRRLVAGELATPTVTG